MFYALAFIIGFNFAIVVLNLMKKHKINKIRKNAGRLSQAYYMSFLENRKKTINDLNRGFEQWTNHD